MLTSTRIAINAASRGLATLANAAVGLMLVPYMIGHYGRDGYGLVSLVVAMVGMSAVADLGLRGSLGRFLSEHAALQNVARFNEQASSALSIYLLMGVTLATTFFVLSADIVAALKIPEQLTHEAQFIIRCYGSPGILLTFLVAAFETMIASSNRFDLINNIQTGVGLLRGALIVGVINFSDWGITGWALAMSMALIVNLLLLGFTAWRITPGLRLRLSLVSRKAVVALLSLGGYVFALQLTALIGIRVDPIILTALLGTAAVTLYAPAASLANAFHPLVETLSHQFSPLATGYHVRGDTRHLQDLLLRGTRYTLLMGIPVCTILAVFADRICAAWLGTTLGTDVATVASMLILWSVIDFFNYAGGVHYPTLLGMNRLRFLVRLEVPLAVLNIAGSILLVRYSQLGVVGVIVPTVIITAVRRPVTALYTAKACGLTGQEYFRASYRRPLVVATILVLAALGLDNVVNSSSLIALVSCVLLTIMLWIVLCWVLGFERNDREVFQQIAGRFRSYLRRSVGAAP